MPLLLRCLTVWMAATAATAALATWLLPVAVSPVAGFDGLLVRACAWVALVAAAWLWLGTGTTIVTSLRGRDVTIGAGTLPAPLRRAVLAACGLVLTGGIAAAPAYATPGHPHQDRLARPAAVAGLPVPDRAAAPAPVPTPRLVTVRPGDSLWSIAAARLGPGATDAEIDAAWQDLYERNRAVVGPDPDLIRPAQRLRAPTSAPTSEVQP